MISIIRINRDDNLPQFFVEGLLPLAIVLAQEDEELIGIIGAIEFQDPARDRFKIGNPRRNEAPMARQNVIILRDNQRLDDAMLLDAPCEFNDLRIRRAHGLVKFVVFRRGFDFADGNVPNWDMIQFLKSVVDVRRLVR